MMDAKKLGALVDEHSKNPLEDMPMEEEMDNEEERGGDILSRGEELITSMGEFGDELKESADIIVDNAMDIGDDLASEEPAPETETEVEDMAMAMPPYMHEGFVEQIASKNPEDLVAIGAALDHSVESDTPQGEHSEDMASKVGGLLGMIGKCCTDGNPEGGESDDDMDSDDMGDDDDMDDNPGY